MPTTIKTIGASGQICLGKEFAGQTVLVEEDPEAGVWVIKRGSFIPDSERWLHTPEMQAKIEKAMQYMDQHPPEDSDIAAVFATAEETRRGE